MKSTFSQSGRRRSNSYDKSFWERAVESGYSEDSEASPRRAGHGRYSARMVPQDKSRRRIQEKLQAANEAAAGERNVQMVPETLEPTPSLVSESAMDDRKTTDDERNDT